MTVARTKSKPAKAVKAGPRPAWEANPSRALKAQLEASIAESPTIPRARYEFPQKLIDELGHVRDEVVLDLKLMASALWTMSYGADPEHTGLCAPQPGEAMRWLERELDRKANLIGDVTSRVAFEIRTGRLADGRGPL